MIFSCKTTDDPNIRKQIDQISKIKSLALDPVCLPNIHYKKNLESPPQFAAPTKNTIVPMLSAPAMNCGMCVITTELTKEDFSEEFLTTFAKNLRQSILPRITKSESFLQWLNLYTRPPMPYDLNDQELTDIFIHGAPAALKKYNMPPEEADHIEYGGCVLSESEKKTIDLSSLIPRSSYKNGKHEFGYNFGGNHFLEIHYVEKIDDPETAKKWNLKIGQLLFFYHGGGGHATYHIGRYFARRMKNSIREKTVLFFLKLFFHFGSLTGILHFPSRWHAYFSSTPFPEISLETYEGKRLMQATKIALNYGYAFRTALLKRINDALPKKTRASFLWDAAHNSIHEEVIKNTPVIMHRQDAQRVFKDKPILISGFNNTLSYVGKGSDNAEKTYYSSSPSAAKTIEQFVIQGISKKENPPHTTYISKRKNKNLEKKDHITSEGLKKIVSILENEDIIKPVAYIRPLGVIKGH